MAEADYRLMTEATGQRIAAALEALHLATVTGVKGATEANYRTGDVNITPANIGALPSDTVLVTGVKGNNEANYRHGEVILTPANLGLVPTSVNVTVNGTYTQTGYDQYGNITTGIRVIRYGNVVNVNANIKLSGAVPLDYGWYTVYSELPKPAFTGYCNGILRFDTAPGTPAMVLINSSGDLQVSPRGTNIQNLQGLLFATYICAN